MAMDDHGTMTIKHYVSKDLSKGKGPWIGGEVHDTIEHIKAHDIVSCTKLD
jgi:hypothetical protein